MVQAESRSHLPFLVDHDRPEMIPHLLNASLVSLLVNGNEP